MLSNEWIDQRDDYGVGQEQTRTVGLHCERERFGIVGDVWETECKFMPLCSKSEG